MGASDSKLSFKQGIFRLSEPKQIAPDDEYWTGFWELPESTEDVFSLFSPADIRRTRDNNLANLETLVLAVTSRLCILRNHPSFPDPDLAPERDALNCIRVLTRILPFVYEADHLESWEDKFFWGARRKRSRRGQIAGTEVIFDEADPEQTPEDKEPEFEKAKPLAEEIIDTLIDLLFFSDFTLPKVPAGKNKVTYAIWQSGVGCNTPVASTKEFENNRTEILRLLLTLASKSMYMSANVLPVKGVRAITYMATCPDKQVVLSVLCSLLNTTLKYNPASWRVPYDHVVFKDQKQVLVTYCLQLLLVLVLYPIPEPGNGPAPRNFFRYFLGRLHRPQDFQFLVDGMTRILNQPLQATSSYLPGSHKSLTWAPEMIMLFWEALQCNKRFRSFIIDTDRAHDFVVLVLFYAIDQRNDPTKQGLVRMCVFVLQTLSVEPNFGRSLNKTFEGQESLPANIRIPNFHGTYADYLITWSIYTLLTTSKGKLDAIYPALLAIINNVAAYVQNLGRAPSSKLLQLLASMSSPSFLFANENNHTLLQALLEALNAMIEHQYKANPNLVYAIIRSRKRFQALRDFTLESGQEEIERQTQLKKENSGDIRRPDSLDSMRSPTVSRTPTLSNVPEENGAFAIGDDEDSDADESEAPQPPRSPLQSPPGASRSASVSSSVDESVPFQVRGMSEKARGKMPVGQPAFSRQNSTTSLNSVATPTLGSNEFFTPSTSWIENWLPELPLHTVLMLISDIAPKIPNLGESNDTAAALQVISEAEVRGIEPSPIKVHMFEWSPLSLGWYESLLWSLIFAGEMLVSKGTAGVWNNTSIRLFKVQEAAAQAPSLLAPRGAVDAVGSNLVQRIGSLNLRGAATQAPQRGAPNGGNSGNAPTTVSSRYLDLTKKKLQLTRLPRELGLPDQRRWEHGTPKSVLEPLLDYWLEHYDWRTQEAHFNSTLPQYRTTFTHQSTSKVGSSQPLRIHFVHKRSQHENAIPLLFCHSWPSSFIEVQKIVDALTDPPSLPSFGAGAQQAFHLVAPSIPGFGFSDASSDEDFGLEGTAEVFHRLMERLGYEQYVAHGSGWAFSICRALALSRPHNCVAIHTTNPSFAEPIFMQKPLSFIKYQIARLTGARIPILSFGYTPAELEYTAAPAAETCASSQDSVYARQPVGTTLSHLYSHRPQTSAFSLCDSPVGLLASMLDIVHTRSPTNTGLASRSRSPFLSPVELGMQDINDNETQSESTVRPSMACSPRQSELNAKDYIWSATEVLNWTMLQWLPGPEGSLRWLWRAHLDNSTSASLQTSYSPVPLGISSFRGRSSTSSSTAGAATPLMWGSGSWRIAWIKRHQRPATLPAWEAPDLVVLDMRECFGTFLSHGIIAHLPFQAGSREAGSVDDKKRGWLL